MTRSELISGLYAHFAQMHDVWMKCTRKWGAGALVFLPNDYERAVEFDQVEWDFWKRDQLVEFIAGETRSGDVLEPDQEEFLSRINGTQFLSVVIHYDEEKNTREVEIRRIDRSLLN